MNTYNSTFFSNKKPHSTLNICQVQKSTHLYFSGLPYLGTQNYIPQRNSTPLPSMTAIPHAMQPTKILGIVNVNKKLHFIVRFEDIPRPKYVHVGFMKTHHPKVRQNQI